MFFWKLANLMLWRKYRGKKISTGASQYQPAPVSLESLFRAFSFFVLADTGTFSGAGIAVRFVVAATDGVVLHRAHTIFFRVFYAFVGFTGESDGEKTNRAEREANVFHWKRKF